jgi:hypothetical protein
MESTLSKSNNVGDIFIPYRAMMFNKIGDTDYINEHFGNFDRTDRYVMWHLAKSHTRDILSSIKTPIDINRLLDWHNSIDNLGNVSVIDRFRGINKTRTNLKLICRNYIREATNTVNELEDIYDICAGYNMYTNIVTNLRKCIPMELINEIIEYVN